MDGGAWQAAVHGVAKSQTRLSNFTLTFHFQALEKTMATYFSILAWRIPGMVEPGGLPSVGSSLKPQHMLETVWGSFSECSGFNSSLILLTFGVLYQLI